MGLLSFVLLALLFLTVAALLQTRARGNLSPISAPLAPGTAGTVPAFSPNFTPPAPGAARSLPWQYAQSLHPVGQLLGPLLDGESIAWSADSRSLAAVAASMIRVCDVPPGQQCCDLTRDSPAENPAAIEDVSWSNDGRFLAVRAYAPKAEAGHNGEIWLMDPTELRNTGVITGLGRVLSTSWVWPPYAPILAYTDGARIGYWDEFARTPPDTMSDWLGPTVLPSVSEAAPPGEGANMTSNLAWSPNTSRLLLATSQHDVVRVWDAADGRDTGSARPGPVQKLVWSPVAGQNVLAALVTDEGGGDAVKLLNMAQGVGFGMISVTIWSGARVSSMAWSANNVLALGIVDPGGGDHIGLYDARTGELLRELPGTAGGVAWSPDAQTLAVADARAGVISLWGTGLQVTPPAVATVPPTPPGTPGEPTVWATRPPPAAVETATPDLISTPVPTAPPPAGLPPTQAAVRGQHSFSGNEPAPGEFGADSGTLSSVAMPAPNDAWAVGRTIKPGSSSATLIMHWDGQSWQRMSSPNKGSSATPGLCGPNAVATVAVDDAWSVGDYTPSNAAPHEMLVLHRDGKSWSKVASPNPGQFNSLTSVAALSRSDVWAVGWYANTDGSAARTLITHWDGAAWSVVPSPNPGAGENRLQAVSASASGEVWAAGYYVANGKGGDTAPSALALRWNGKEWIAMPAVPTRAFNALAVVSPSDVLAAGDGVWRWDGLAWAAVAAADSLSDIEFTDIAASLSTDIWATGQNISATPGKAGMPAVYRWNAEHKKLESLSIPYGPGYNLSSVALVAGRGAVDVLAVGGKLDAGDQSSLRQSLLMMCYTACAINGGAAP